MRIFINGTLDAATTPATAANTPRATTAPVLIGGDSSTHRFSGTLDDVSIYARALSDSEIADLANIVDKRYQYHHLNALGSNIVLTDDNQNVLVRYEYDIFGAIRSETGTSDNTRKFTGKKFDADSNLYYYAARYYDPYIGRFTQRDPIADGVNWYAYTYNNPLRFIDPDGLRGLTKDEKDMATEIFGDMIDLEQVEIKGALPLLGDNAVAVHNYIFVDDKKLRGEPDLLIHELVHVWQYQQGTIEPITAGLTGLTAEGIERIAGKDDLLYDYRLDDFKDPNRRHISEYHFEHQAAIIRDAYRYQNNMRPLHNDEMRRFDWKTDYWTEYYETILEEFKQWHGELQQSSSSSHMTHN